MNDRQARRAEPAASALKGLWKRVPTPARAAAHRSIQHLVAATTAPQVWLNWRRGTASTTPVSIVGFFGSASGVGEAARLFAAALESDGLPVARLDVTDVLGFGGSSAWASDPPFPSGVVVSFLNPPELLRWLPRGGAQTLRGKRHIGYWFWELPDAPKAWNSAFRYVDEVWCQSTFTAGAVSRLAPAVIPTKVVPHPIFIYGAGTADRASLGFSPETCVVLSLFDLRSTIARKNPLGALKTFLNAVPSPDPTKAVFVCKIRGEDGDPAFKQLLLRAEAERPDIIVLRGDFTDDQMRRLVASVDVAISLHRAEGFGLLAAEAMWLGKTVLTTGWSGVLDFAGPTSAVLVDYNLVPVKDPQGIYSGGLWAEPDIADASKKLKAIIDHASLRDEIGAEAKRAAALIFDRENWLSKVREAFDFLE